MKIDPYKNKEKYLIWKDGARNGISGLNKESSDIILQYLNDMERGVNIASASVKGARGYNRLNTLRIRLPFFANQFNKKYGLQNITKINEDDLISFFTEMRNGEVKRLDGKNYASADTYAKVFKAFWHWWMKVNRKRGIEIKDITTDLDVRQEKPDWVYLTEEQVKVLAENSKFEYKVLIYFLFDTGIRSPTELINVRVSDLFNDFKEVHIREEVSKTFGRRIKLMLCSNLIKDYIRLKNLKSNDQLFCICPSATNRYLKSLARKVFGDETSPAGSKYSDLTMYDFRHISCCYWLPRYKSESALKYRFGWKKSDKIHYYSELLGMKDTISDEDLLIDTTKTELEQRLAKSEKEREILQERMKTMETQMAKIMELTNRLSGTIIVASQVY